MITLETDVLVVGAGPGGSMAAKFAAINGARTLLIEKRQEIGSPVRCAEGIARDWMKECGIAEEPGWIACIPEGARFFSPDGTCAFINVKSAGNEVGLVLERVLFDKALARHAAEAGAEILLKTHARGVLKAGGSVAGIAGKSMGRDIEIHARVTIAADGFESQVGRWAGLETSVAARDIISTFQYRLCNIEQGARCCDFYVGSCAPGGYIWVFPKGPNVANVGIGVQLTRLRAPGETRQYLDRWIGKHPELAKGKALDMVAGAVSANRPLAKTVGSGIMLVGDAARLINPLTGGGIVNACISGKLAGETAAAAVKRGDCSERYLQKYEKAWRARLEQELLRNWMAKEKVARFDDETFNRIVATLAEARPDANSRSLLLAIGKKHPSLVAEFSQLLWA
jgi:digeranylgeranylglycerophospholipid reductase